MTPNWRDDSTVRRLGLRHELPKVLVATAERRRTSRWRRATQLEIAVADVSASGVGFYGPAETVLLEKEPITVRIDGTQTELRVRRVEPAPDGEVVRYGAEFMEGFPALLQVAEAAIALGPSPEVPPRD